MSAISRPLVAAALVLGLGPAHAIKPKPRATVTVAPAASAAPRKVTSVEGITEYALDNGLRVLLFPDTSKPTVTVNVTYMVGSRHEGYGETGMAHLLEHMVFKGTAKHDSIWHQFEKHGANFNGTTSYDRTNYFEILPAVDGNLEFALEIEADRMVNSRIAKEELAKEFSVVRNEFEMGENSPVGVLEERMLSTAFLWHNYGKSPIGSREDIERVPIENLRAFYQRYYQPDNAMLVVAGKFDPAQALALVQKHFGPLPRPKRVLSPTYTVEPVQDGERSVQLRRSGDVAVVGLVYHGVAGGHEDHVAEEALIDVLANKPSGRLYRALVESNLAVAVSGEAEALTDPGFLKLFAKVRPEGGQATDKATAKMIEVVENLGKQPITDEEVARFKVKALKAIDLGLTDSNRIGVELSEFAAVGDWRMIFVHRDRIKALTADRVRRVAASYLKQSNRTLGVFQPTRTPDRAPASTVPDVAAMVKDYKGGEALSAGEVFDGTVENIEKRTARSALPGGMKLALLSKSTRGHAVVASLAIHFGSEADLKGKVITSQMVPRMLSRGSKKHTFQQLKDELDRLKANLVIEGDEPGTGGLGVARLRVTTVRENLPAVLALIAEIVSQPAFPVDQFEVVRKEQLAQLEENLQDPQAQGFSTLFRKISPWPATDVRHSLSIAEQIAGVRALKLEEVAAIHRELWGAGNAELAVVGDFDEALVKKTVAAAFGGWRATRPFARIAIPFHAGPPSEETLRTPDKQNAIVALGYALELRDDDPDYPTLRLLNFVLGASPKSRLMERLRQKEGLSYGAFSRVGADPFDKNGLLFAGAICAPQNAARAMELLVEETSKLAREGIAQAELDEVKKAYQLTFDGQIAQDPIVARLLAASLDIGRTLEYQRKSNAAIQSLTVADVARVAKKYIDVTRAVKITAGDLK